MNASERPHASFWGGSGSITMAFPSVFPETMGDFSNFSAFPCEQTQSPLQPISPANWGMLDGAVLYENIFSSPYFLGHRIWDESQSITIAFWPLISEDPRYFHLTPHKISSEVCARITAMVYRTLSYMHAHSSVETLRNRLNEDTKACVNYHDNSCRCRVPLQQPFSRVLHAFCLIYIFSIP